MNPKLDSPSNHNINKLLIVFGFQIDGNDMPISLFFHTYCVVTPLFRIEQHIMHSKLHMVEYSFRQEAILFRFCFIDIQIPPIHELYRNVIFSVCLNNFISFFCYIWFIICCIAYALNIITNDTANVYTKIEVFHSLQIAHGQKITCWLIPYFE